MGKKTKKHLKFSKDVEAFGDLVFFKDKLYPVIGEDSRFYSADCELLSWVHVSKDDPDKEVILVEMD